MAKSSVTSGASHEPGREPDGWPVPAEPDPGPEAPDSTPALAVPENERPGELAAGIPEPAPVKPAKASPSLSEPKAAGITGSGGVTVPKAGAGGA